MTWLFFAMIYWIIAYYHGDFDKVAIAEFENKTCPNESCWKYCVLKIEDFASCFLFSLETQVNIKDLELIMKSVKCNYYNINMRSVRVCMSYFLHLFKYVVRRSEFRILTPK